MQSKVERVAAGAGMLQDALDDQLLPLFDSMTDVMADVFKEFMVLAITYMSEEQLDNIVGS